MNTTDLFVRGLLLVGLLAVASASKAQPRSTFLTGGDVSEIPEVEAAGGKYFYKGKEMDPFAIMKQAGWNFVRFRVWNEPKDGWCDKEHTLAMAKRAKKAGLKISIDFHYSDWWADPGKQNKPKAWKDLPFDDLVKAVYDYTKDVVGSLVAQGTPPIIVQIGNEITPGMLWPDGRVSGENPEVWAKLAKLFEAGTRAVHDVQGRRRILTMAHLDRGGDNKGARWWLDNMNKQGVEFDAIGLSYYSFWHGTLKDLTDNVNDLATRYGKDIYIVETSYPWKPEAEERWKKRLEPDFPATPEGQAAFLRRVAEIIKQVPDGHGKGLLYWAPTWIPTPKNPRGWGTLATFDDKGNALPAVDALGGKG